MNVFSQQRNLLRSLSLSWQVLSTYREQVVLCKRCLNTLRKASLKSFYTKYSEEENDKILTHFNKSTADYLHIGKLLNMQKAIAICKQREDVGQFKSVKDILQVVGVGSSSLEKYCDVIKSAKNLEKFKLNAKDDCNAFYPTLSQNQIENIRDVVALDLQLNCLTWTHLGHDLTVKDWSYSVIFDKTHQKYDFFIWINKLEELLKDLPTADVYIIENKSLRVISLKMAPLAINYRVTEAMLMTLLTVCKKSMIQMCKPLTVGKYVDIIIGGERVSAINVLTDILQNKSSIFNCILPSYASQSFYKADDMQRECLSNSLLLALTFQKLVMAKVKETSS